MKTLVLEIGDLAGAAYPLRLVYDGETPIEEELPADLSVVPPVLSDKGVPIDAKLAREAFAGGPHAAQHFDRLGEYLFRLLNAGDVGVRWAQLRALPAGSYRLVLDVRPPELQSLPWELAAEPHKAPIFADPRRPVVRGRIAAETCDCHDLPLRVLVVVACDAKDSRIRWLEELAGIKDALVAQKQFVDFHVEHRPSLLQLERELKRFHPHVLHFIGHGFSHPPALAIWQEAINDNIPWNAGGIDLMLASAPAPRFVFLNACRSAGEELSQIAAAFLSAGSKAVLAMSGDIDGRVAAELARGVYEALAEQKPLDRAIAQARAAAKQLPQLEHGADWAMASFVTTVAPETVIPIHRDAQLVWDELKRSAGFEEIRKLVDRHPHRHALTEKIDPGIPARKASRLTLLTGDAGTGKSLLIEWCLYRSLLRGRRVLLVDLERDKRLSYLGLLETIVRGDDRSGSKARQPIAELASFRAAAAALLGLDVRAPLPAELVLPQQNTPEHLAQKIFDAFLKVIVEVAKKQPLILALDHLSREGRGVQVDHFKQFVIDRLIVPIATGAIDSGADLRLLISLRDSDVALLELDKVPNKEVVAIPAFRRHEWAENAIEYYQHLGHTKYREQLAPVFAAMGVQMKDPWSPRELQALTKFFPIE